MEKQKDKMWFSHHAKSSAAVVSVGIHALLLVLALSFVAVTVITKDDKKFEAKQVTRPKMPIKRLQVPVNVKKKAPKPKLRKRIVVKPNINKSMPDIKMPEVSGLKGGLGAAGGLGGSAGIGFSMPEISVFGVKGKGEKIFIALDANSWMLRPDIGGMPAYALVKEELKNVISRLSPTTLFNLAVFNESETEMLFPKMVPASSANIDKLERWLDPLNKVGPDMTKDDYGLKTIGEGGVSIRDGFTGGKIKDQEAHPSGASFSREWYTPLGLAMQQQADTVFLLTGRWGVMRYLKPGKTGDAWAPGQQEKYQEKVLEAKAMLAEENDELLAKGEPPLVMAHTGELLDTFFGEGTTASLMPTYQVDDYYFYTPRDVAESLYYLRKKYAQKTASKSGLKKKSKSEFSLNVIFFTSKQDGMVSSIEPDKYESLAKVCKGEFRVMTGLDSIKSARDE